MKKTVLNDTHRSLGAKMVPFAGFDMPVEYAGITAEHLAVRNAAGMFDVSHMGEFWVKGPNALKFLQKVTSNDVSTLTTGKIQYTCFPNGKGGIVDDLLVYRYDDEKYLLVVNAGNIDKDWNWCMTNNAEGAILENASDRISQLAIQGPKATAILQKLTTVDLSAIPYYTFVTGQFAGVNNVIISNTGYTGAGGFELYMYNNDVVTLWNEIMKAGENEGLVPVGLGARDTLRLEMGFCLYGNDIDDTTSPIEAGLGWITKFADGKNFIDRDLMLEQKNDGVKRRLKSFVMEEKGIPRHDYEIVDSEGNVIGRVTSGTMSPVLKQGIGMGYICSDFLKKKDDNIAIRVRNRDLKAKIVKTPFI
ncbi:MAG: glycine cleavage system aminomethyltransferase GcvT [Cytophagaceae bacterium]|jgi:aminomethyltransferase|nr:glycine cleavage system aminomethyltransferase GcvT [Cytophagaceae bacterium]